VAASVRHALRCRALVAEDEQVWKWLSLGMHSALQGACICHLVTTAAPVGAVTKKNAAEWLSYFEASRNDPNAKPPATYLLDLPSLLKQVRKPHSAGNRSNENGISITDGELRRLKSFHTDLRNQFTHFAPRGWAIEISGTTYLESLVSRIVAEIQDAGWAFRQKGEAWQEAFRADLKELRGE